MFEEQVSNLYAARQLVRQFQTDVDESYEEWRAKNEIKIARAEQAKMDLKEIEDGLRAAIVTHYSETGDKKPHPKLGIRISQVAVYDIADAELYVREYAPALLTLDTKAFGRYAKAWPDKVGFVSWQEKVTPTIARDLG